MLIAAALALVTLAAALGQKVIRSQAQRPETGVFAGLAAEIEALGMDEVSRVRTVEDEWEPMQRAA